MERGYTAEKRKLLDPPPQIFDTRWDEPAWRTDLLTQLQMPEELHLSPWHSYTLWTIACIFYTMLYDCCAFCDYKLLACIHFVLYLRKTQLGRNIVQKKAPGPSWLTPLTSWALHYMSNIPLIVIKSSSCAKKVLLFLACPDSKFYLKE